MAAVGQESHRGMIRAFLCSVGNAQRLNVPGRFRQSIGLSLCPTRCLVGHRRTWRPRLQRSVAVLLLACVAGSPVSSSVALPCFRWSFLCRSCRRVVLLCKNSGQVSARRATEPTATSQECKRWSMAPISSEHSPDGSLLWRAGQLGRSRYRRDPSLRFGMDCCKKEQ